MYNPLIDIIHSYDDKYLVNHIPNHMLRIYNALGIGRLGAWVITENSTIFPNLVFIAWKKITFKWKKNHICDYIGM